MPNVYPHSRFLAGLLRSHLVDSAQPIVGAEVVDQELDPEVAERYGHVPPRSDSLVEKLNAVVAAQNWPLVATISAELERRKGGQEAV